MTCIVGIANAGKIWIGGDRCVSTNDGFYSLLDRPKVFSKKVPVYNQPDEQMIIGCAGSVRAFQLMELQFETPVHFTEEVDVFTYITTDFIESVVEFFNRKGVNRKGKETDFYAGEMLIGYKEELFYVDEGYQVITVTEQEYAAGSGSPYALASLFTSRKTKWPPKQRIEEALLCAEAHNNQTKGPFDLVSL